MSSASSQGSSTGSGSGSAFSNAVAPEVVRSRPPSVLELLAHATLTDLARFSRTAFDPSASRIQFEPMWILCRGERSPFREEGRPELRVRHNATFDCDSRADPIIVDPVQMLGSHDEL